MCVCVSVLILDCVLYKLYRIYLSERCCFGCHWLRLLLLVRFCLRRCRFCCCWLLRVVAIGFFVAQIAAAAAAPVVRARLRANARVCASQMAAQRSGCVRQVWCARAQSFVAVSTSSSSSAPQRCHCVPFVSSQCIALLRCAALSLARSLARSLCQHSDDDDATLNWTAANAPQDNNAFAFAAH